MPAKKEYTVEFKDQAVRFVLEEIEGASDLRVEWGPVRGTGALQR